MEKADLQTKTLNVDGMFCINCQNRIEKALKGLAGVEDASVSYEKSTASISYNGSIVTLSKIKQTIEEQGYKVVENDGNKQKKPERKAASSPEKETSNKTASQIIGTLVIILGLYVLLRAFSTSALAAAFPVAQTGMGYGIVLIIGLVTSVHCIAMCGGINLSQTLKESREVPVTRYSLLLPSVLYNSGRILSYTTVGIVVGAIGSVITVSGRFQGAILLIAGIFMLIMGLNMLGLFPSLRRFMPRMPKIFTQKINSLSPAPNSLLPTPLIIGFLNGFMPCGPLQAMQIYALSTGSPVRGGISMFLFCLGTIPLMFALGAAGGILSGAKGRTFSRRVMQIGAILIAAMGLTMFTNGWNLTGIGNPFNSPLVMRNGTIPSIQDDVQIINSTLQPNRYPAITVQQGIPVRWTINAPRGSINGCNNRFIIREYGIEHTFKYGDNVIEFMPLKTGRFPYSCWMGMIRSSITVTAEGDISEQDITPKPAGVKIPTDGIAVAQIMGNYQSVKINLTDNGFEPAIVVMQNRLPALWNISISSNLSANTQLIFPAYYTILFMEQGDNTLQIMPIDDFDFSTGDNLFYGYVKVADDINNVDIDAVKAQAANFVTLIYPPAYFEDDR